MSPIRTTILRLWPWLRGSLAAFALALCCSTSAGSVYLEFAPSSEIFVNPGGSFHVTLNLVSTAEEVVGLDYRLEVSGAASGFLTLTGRNLSGTPFSDPVETNAAVLAPAVAIMDPSNALSLGAWTPSFEAIGPGTFQVAVFTISIDSNAPLGSYTLQTISPPDAGWFDGSFEDHAFDSPATVTVTVNAVPEPAAVGLMLLGGAVLILRGRRLARVVVIPAVMVALLSPAGAQSWPNYEFRQFNNKMNYRLCKPKDYDPAGSAKYPLVIFWHGNGETEVVAPFVVGDPTQCNSAQMADCGQFQFMSEVNQAQFPCFLVLPQRKTADGTDTNTPALAAALVDALAAEFRIDTDRVIVTGLSGGGGRTLACAVANPTKYAAIVPLSTIIPGSTTQVAAAIQNIPTWFFHSVNDGIVGIGGTTDTLVRDLRKIGARPIYTRYALGDHTPAMWTHCYKTPPLIPWLAAQRRGQPSKNDPARVVIHQPTTASSYSTSLSSVPFSGIVEMNQPGTLNGPEITKVEWAKGDYHQSSNRNPASGISTWVANSSPSLNATGQTILEAVAVGTDWAPDYRGFTYYSATLFVNKTTSGDFTAPSVHILSPTVKATWKTKAVSLKLAGSASDANGVVRVEWRNNRGGSGQAGGLSSWSAQDIPLQSGENILTVTALDGNGNAGSDTLTVTNDRPADANTSLWTGVDVGEGSTPGVFPGVPGSFHMDSGTITVRGSGSTMWGTDNQYYFVHQPVSGDFQFTARITAQQAAGQGSAGGNNIAGLMIADTLTRNARYAIIGCSGGDRASFRSHYNPNDTWGGSAHNSAFRPPCWVRLTRVGSLFTSEVSTDGSTWTAIAPNENIGILSNAYVGFGVNSADNTVASTAVFDNISLSKGVAPVLLGAASRMTHGAAGALDIDLPLAGTIGIEPRIPSPPATYVVRCTFDKPIVSAAASIESGTGSVISATASGNIVTVTLGGVPSGQILKVKLQNVVPVGGGLSGSGAVSLGILLGDANSSRSVTAADVALVKSSVGKPVDSTTARYDIDADGDIDTLDSSLIKNGLGSALPSP